MLYHELKLSRFYEGVTINKLLVQNSAEEIQSIINTNLLGTMFASKAAVRFMMRRNSGSIVNVGEFGGVTPVCQTDGKFRRRK